MRAVRRLVLVVSWLALLPASAFAQSALAGVIRDASGGVLPGVAVEAASPVLIEKVRTAVSDATGQYRITDLARRRSSTSEHAARSGAQQRSHQGAPCDPGFYKAIVSLVPSVNDGSSTGRPAIA